MSRAWSRTEPHRIRPCVPDGHVSIGGALLKRKGSSAPPIETWPFSGTQGLMRWGSVRDQARDIAALADGSGRG